MGCKYTSKTSTEIKTIISDLETQIIDAQVAGNQNINYNGISYSLDNFIYQIEKMINMWLERLCWAEQQEGVSTKKVRFTRYEGYC